MPDSPPLLNLPMEVPDAPRRVIADRYEVVSVIGQGSAARTLLCSDLREHRRVVVKELHFAHLSDWKYLELFEREAKMLGRLEHPSIPRVFDYFQGESATFYIVQEYIEAPSLLQRIESGPMLGQKEIYEIAVGLLDVLEYLHGRAPPVIHRDIKPSNVLLRASGTPALIDFGGVRAAWQPGGAAGTTVVGTFGYMAPERLLDRETLWNEVEAVELRKDAQLAREIVGGLDGSYLALDTGDLEKAKASMKKQEAAQKILDELAAGNK